ncbi:FAD-dependent oxidoreductase [Pedococcus sp. 5OH_020]|uniref:FAD-dependent oxidoreductase n=1 Tax=Pedococcus sp. 5OH_020 TaxID=2989814 RepID=UPI0022E9FE17|nr:FAD-dependent oxidoreductase [Pedococcus sp. 5OH_020]
MTAADGTTVVVVGGSMAGLLAARALSDHAASVVVFERERLTEEVAPRGHVPQGRHLHLLLAAGLDLLRQWFPGIEEDLKVRGAVPVDGHRAWVHQGGAYRARGDWGRPVLCLTRPLLEHVVRERVAATCGVTLESGSLAERVTVTGRRVTGVVVAGVERPAGLVVDCSGRSSRIAQDLATSRLLMPPITRVGIDIGYSSFFMRRSPDDLEGDSVVCIDTPGSFRAASVLPVEGDRWQVALGGVHGDVPPCDDEGIHAFAAALPSPVVGQLLDRCERLSPVATYRFPSSQRRHYEKSPLLQGFVTLGDASSSFDPIYGQGMTSAALQAAALGEAARTLGVLSPELPNRFHRKAAQIIDSPWRIAVGGDFAHPATTGPRPLGTAQLNRYGQRVVQAAHVSLPVARTFNRVLQLSDPPAVLLRPDMLVRVLTSARRSPAVTGDAVSHPRVGLDTPD